MRETKIVIVCFLFNISLFGQTIPSEYYYFTKQADSLFQIKKYKASAFAYSKAFETLGWKGFQEDRYKAATAWAMAGYPDSAIFNLERIAFKTSFSDATKVSNDKYLKSIHTHRKWKPLLEKVKANSDSIAAIAAKLDKNLIRKLDSLSKVDQKWRHLSTRIRNGLVPKDSINRQEVTYNMINTDSMNFYEVRRIFYKHGFPNYDLVGEEGAGNFWLIVQHQDRHPKFQDSVLSDMKTEVDRGKASKSNYAYLVDRVRVNTGQSQIYGTQLQLNKNETSYEPKEVIEPDKLNERRKSMDLGTVEAYIEYANKRYFGTLKKN